MKALTVLPDDIRDALKRDARRLLLVVYVGGKRQLQFWSDLPAGRVWICSGDISGDKRANLRRLRRLVRDGLLYEHPHGPGEWALFRAPYHVMDQIGNEAQAEIEAEGYRPGVIMGKIE